MLASPRFRIYILSSSFYFGLNEQYVLESNYCDFVGHVVVRARAEEGQGSREEQERKRMPYICTEQR